MYVLVSAVLLLVILGIVALGFALVEVKNSSRVPAQAAANATAAASSNTSSSNAAAASGGTEPFSDGVVVVSLTTSPQRLPKIKEAIDSLYARQTRKPDYIVLNLPHVFLRNNSTYDLDQVPYRDQPFLVINACEDIGPITKWVPAVKLLAGIPNARIVVADDDIEYPPQLIEKLVESSDSHPDAVITAHCLNGYYTLPTPLKCEIIEGYQAYLLKPGFFDASFDAYLETALRSRDCFVSDDYVLSNYIHNARLPVFHYAQKDLGGPVRPIEYGLQDDALHKQLSVPHPERYCSCFRYLQDAGVPTSLPAKCGSR